MANQTGDGSDNTLTGSTSAESLVGLGGNDILNGGAGNDTLDGGDGDDTLNGGTGRDLATYANALAGVIVNLGTGTATGGAGSDRLISIEDLVGTSFDDTLTGDGAVNSLDGGDGNDSLYGEGGNDALRGGGGSDALAGGLGADTMDGGSGADVFRYTAAAESSPVSRDVINGFVAGTDQIDLSPLGVSLSWGGTTAGANKVWYTPASGYVLVNADTDGNGAADLQIRVNGMTSITAASFIGVTIDTTPPGLPVITSVVDSAGVDTLEPGAGGVTNDTTVGFVGTGEPGATLRVYDGASTTALRTVAVSSGGHWSFTTPALTQGIHNLRFVLTDSDGNASAPLHYALNIDLTPPAAPVITDVVDDAIGIIGSITNGGTSNDPNLEVRGTAEAGATVTLYNGTTVLGTGIADGSGNWSIITSALPDATTVSLRARATDAAANTSALSAARTVTIDRTPPTVVADTADGAEDQGTAITGNVLGNDTNPGGGAMTAALVSGPAHAGSFTFNADGTFSYTPAADFAGADTFTYVAMDEFGNKSAPATVTLNIAGVNDAPVNAGLGALELDENTTVAINGLSVSDVDAGASPIRVTIEATDGVGNVNALSAASGVTVTETASGVVLTGAPDAINATLGTSGAIVFVATPEYFGTDGTLVMTTEDLGNSGSGGALSDVDTVAITINGANEAPVLTDVSIGAAGIQFTATDPDSPALSWVGPHVGAINNGTPTTLAPVEQGMSSGYRTSQPAVADEFSVVSLDVRLIEGTEGYDEIIVDSAGADAVYGFGLDDYFYQDVDLTPTAPDFIDGGDGYDTLYYRRMGPDSDPVRMVETPGGLNVEGFGTYAGVESMVITDWWNAPTDTIDFSAFTSPVSIGLEQWNGVGSLQVGIFGFEGIVGGSGSDSLAGWFGANTIEGGEGGDFLTGRDGADRFVFAAGDSAGTMDVILDYTKSVDIIDYETAITLFGGAITAGPTIYDTIANVAAALQPHEAGNQGLTALFVQDGFGFVYIADGVGDTAPTSGDVIIRLNGMTAIRGEVTDGDLRIAGPIQATIQSVIDDNGVGPNYLYSGASSNDPTLVVMGTAGAGNSIELRSGETVIGTAVADGSGNWTITTDPLAPDTTHALQAVSGDATGELAEPSAAFFVTIDLQTPVAENDSFEAYAERTLFGNVMLNDSTAGLSGEYVSERSGPSHANSFWLSSSGEFNYEPVAGFTGTDSFTYSLIDAAGNESGVATVTINVVPLGVAPQISNISAGPGGITFTATDPDSPTLSFASPFSGAVNNDGSATTYVPSQRPVTDRFSYLWVTDGPNMSRVDLQMYEGTGNGNLRLLSTGTPVAAYFFGGNDTARVSKSSAGGSPTPGGIESFYDGGAGTDTLQIQLFDIVSGSRMLTSTPGGPGILGVGNHINFESVVIIDERGGSNDTLDTSAFAGGITLALGDVSSVGGVNLTVRNFENIRGGDGNDTFVGNGVANVITGGRGADVFTGGGGMDRFEFSAGDSGPDVAGIDVITDLTGGQDVIGYEVDLVRFTGEFSIGVDLVSTIANIAAAFAPVEAGQQGLTATFVFEGNGYVYIADGVASATPSAGDVVIRLDGVTSINAWSVIGGDLARPLPPVPAITEIIDDVPDGVGPLLGYLTNDANLEVRGTASPNATVELLNYFTPMGTVVADASGAWSIQTGTLPEWTWVGLSAREVTDGMVGPATPWWEVLVDSEAPVAVDDTAIGVKDYWTNGNVTFNDTLGISICLVQLIDSPVHFQSFSLASDGSFGYLAHEGFTGTDTFSYQLVDLTGNRSAVATVTLTVTENTPPVISGLFADAAGLNFTATDAENAALYFTGEHSGLAMSGMPAVLGPLEQPFGTTRVAEPQLADGAAGVSGLGGRLQEGSGADDVFHLTSGEVDAAFGFGGNDLFVYALGSGPMSADYVDGGDGADTIRYERTIASTDPVVVVEGASGPRVQGTGSHGGIEAIVFRGDADPSIDTLDFSNFASPFEATLDGTTTIAGVSVSIENTEHLIGGGGSDFLTGNGAGNSLVGNGGPDLLDGRGGADVLTGGGDVDVFNFTSGDSGPDVSAIDVITDYSAGVDVIRYASELTWFTGGSVSVAADLATTIDNAAALLQTSEVASPGHATGFVFEGDAYLFIGDGVAGSTASANDVLIKLAGITTIGSVGVSGTDLILSA